MTDDAMDVARDALDLARDAQRKIDGHENICALRYAQLDNSIKSVKSIISWAGTTGFALIMGALIFFIKGQFDANAEMQKTIQNLQQQQATYERNQ